MLVTCTTYSITSQFRDTGRLAQLRARPAAAQRLFSATDSIFARCIKFSIHVCNSCPICPLETAGVFSWITLAQTLFVNTEKRLGVFLTKTLIRVLRQCPISASVSNWYEYQSNTTGVGWNTTVLMAQLAAMCSVGSAASA